MIRLYGLNACDTCKKARNFLTRKGVAHEFVDYREQRIPPETLKDWAKQIGWSSLVNKTSKTWRELPASRKSPQFDPEWTLLIREHPAIVKRPVIVREDGTVSVGFNPKMFD